MSKDGLVLLVAAGNEEKNIAEVVLGAKKYAARILVVDDGSRDATAKEAEEAGAVVISHKRRRGKGAATKTGLRYILENFKDFDAVMTLDGDGQHYSPDIAKVLEAASSGGADLVIGARNYRNMPLVRSVWNRLSSFFISLITGINISDSQSGLRWISKKLVEELVGSLKTDDYRVESEMLFIAAEKGFKTIQTGARSIYNKDFSFKPLPGYFWRAAKISAYIIFWPMGRRPRFALFLKLVFVGAFIISFPHLLMKDYFDLNNPDADKLSDAKERYAAFAWLKNNSSPDDIVLGEWTEGNNIVAAANRRVIVSSKVYPSEAKEVAQRYTDLSRFFFSTSAGEAKEVLKKYQASWIFLNKDFDNFICNYTGRCLWPGTLMSDILSDKKIDYLRKAYESKNTLIYKVVGEADKDKGGLVHLVSGDFSGKLIAEGFGGAQKLDNEKAAAAGLIMPHHYPYVNYLLADVLSRVQPPREVIVLGPEHNPSGAAAKTSLAVWGTPFGEIYPAEGTLEALVDKNSAIIDNEAYLNEWSVSTILPYVKYIFPDATAAPILVNNNIADKQIKVLSEILSARVAAGALMILSTDFVHQLSQEEGDRADEASIREIFSLNGENIDSLVLDARGGLKLFMEIMRKAKVKSAQLVGHSSDYQEERKYPEFKTYPYLVTYQTWLFKK